MDSRFDLFLEGFRNERCRDDVLRFLLEEGDRYPGAAPALPDTVPGPLARGIDLAAGLHWSRRLRNLGANVRLVPAEPETTSAPAPPTQRAVRSFPAAFPVLLALALGLALLPLLEDPRRDDPWVAAGARSEEQLRVLRRLNGEALDLNDRGDFAGAADRLRQALEHRPDQTLLRHNLRTILGNWAVAELDADHPAAAVRLAEEALSIDDDPTVYQLLGTAHLRSAQWEHARAALEKAVSLGATDPDTLLALGQVYRKLGNRTGAVEMFQRAEAMGASGVPFETMLSRLERELDAEWDFAEMQSAHFRISFAEEENREAARIVLHSLEEAHAIVGRRFGVTPPGRTSVVLYSGEDFHDISQTPDWAGGVFDGRIKLPVRGLSEGNASLDRTVRHELGHVIVSLLSGGHCPVWLSEGLAIWGEEGGRGPRLSWAREQMRTADPLPLSKLTGSFMSLDPSEVPVAYAKSYLVVRNLVATHGIVAVRDLLAALGGGVPFEDAFRQTFGIGTADLDRDLAFVAW